MAERSAFAQCLPYARHGLVAGSAPSHTVRSHIEITPFDTVKQELDALAGCPPGTVLEFRHARRLYSSASSPGPTVGSSQLLSSEVTQMEDCAANFAQVDGKG